MTCRRAGWLLTRAPNGLSASLMALITAANAPAVPASPAPLRLQHRHWRGAFCCRLTPSRLASD